MRTGSPFAALPRWAPPSAMAILGIVARARLADARIRQHLRMGDESLAFDCPDRGVRSRRQRSWTIPSLPAAVA